MGGNKISSVVVFLFGCNPCNKVKKFCPVLKENFAFLTSNYNQPFSQ